MNIMRTSRLFLATLKFLLVAVLVTSCWGRPQPDLEVSLQSNFAEEPPGAVARHGDGEVVHFALASVLSPERSTQLYAQFGRYLATKIGRPVEIVQRRTYAELNELLRSGAADAGLVCSGAFAVGGAEFGLTPIAIPIVRGKRTYRSLVIVRRDSGWSSFGDLEGGTFAFTDPLSNSGYRYVAARLHADGLDVESYFGRVQFTHSHDFSIEAVADGLVDAAAVDSLVWNHLVDMRPQLRQSLQIIDQSEEFPINPVVVSPATSSQLARRLAGVLFAMRDDSAGRRLLPKLGVDAFVSPSAIELAGYDKIARSWRELGTLAPSGEAY